MRSIRRSGRRWHDRGAAAVEMAIVLPMLLLVIGGIVDFGRYFLTEIQLTNAAREGTRMAVVSDSLTAADVQLRVEEAAPGISAVTIPDLTLCDGSGPNAIVTVEVTDYKWFLIEPASKFFGASIDLPEAKSTAVMRCEV